MNQPNQPGLTAEVYELIRQNEPLLSKPRQVFQPHEMTGLYQIYNAYTGENKRDGGCGACRTNIVNRVRKIYEEYKNSL